MRLQRIRFYSRNLIFMDLHITQFLLFVHFLTKNLESKFLQSHLSMPTVTTTTFLLPPPVMATDKAAGSLAIACIT